MTATAHAEASSEEDLVGGLIDRLLAEHPPESTAERDFLGAQFDAGLAFVHFPVGHGGLGISRKLQPMITDRLQGAGAAVRGIARNVIGYGMAAPTILAQGSEEQKKRYLRPLFTCEDIWCQLFSEPGAGSDVASLSTRAARDGDEWSINGQKTWTTLAHTAHYGLLLVRSALTVFRPCTDLMFARSIALHPTADTIYAHFDSVHVEGWNCIIKTIQPVDYLRMQRDLRRQREAAKSRRKAAGGG